MWEPKITKLCGGYSADAELMFWSWQPDILANIQDRELDNKAAIQLIKEQTLDNAHREVKFQLDLCGRNIMYQNLLRHLSITFQGGDDEANLLAEFYSHGQKLKESRGGVHGQVANTHSQGDHQEARLQSQPRLNTEAALCKPAI